MIGTRRNLFVSIRLHVPKAPYQYHKLHECTQMFVLTATIQLLRLMYSSLFLCVSSPVLSGFEPHQEPAAIIAAHSLKTRANYVPCYHISLRIVTIVQACLTLHTGDELS
jgi:hypothetical protein